MPPTNSASTVFIAEPTGLYPADGQEQPLPQQNNFNDSVNTEGLIALFINKSPQHLPAFLKYCGTNKQSIDLNRLAQELEKSKSPDQQPPQ
jgi:hypothetical protein